MSPKRRTVDDEPFVLVRSSASDLDGAARIGSHAHHWHQLAYVTAGLMVVEAAGASWLAPSTWAVWLPAGVDHALRFVGPSSLRTLYIRPDLPLDAPEACRSLAVSALLRELIGRIVDTGMLDGRDPLEGAMATLLFAEIEGAGPPPFALPQPSSPVTIEAARLIAGRIPGGLGGVAAAVGSGRRTLERRFQAETGLTPGRWAQHARLLLGLERIAAGDRVKLAAAAAGFASASAFVAAVRRATGRTPASLFRRMG